MFQREELVKGIENLNALLSYVKRVEGTDQFPAIVADWNLLEDQQKTIVGLMAISKLADYLLEEAEEK